MNHCFQASLTINATTGLPYVVCSHCGEFKGSVEANLDCTKAPQGNNFKSPLTINYY